MIDQNANKNFSMLCQPPVSCVYQDQPIAGTAILKTRRHFVNHPGAFGFPCEVQIHWPTDDR